MNTNLFRRIRPLRCFGAGLVVIAFFQPGVGYGQAPETVLLNPGTRTTIAVDSAQSDCVINEIGDVSRIVGFPTVTCSDNPAADIPLQVLAASAVSKQFQLFNGVFTSIQNLDATARLFRDIQIPLPQEEPFLSTLRLQVATEAAWSGGFLVGGAWWTAGAEQAGNSVARWVPAARKSAPNGSTCGGGRSITLYPREGLTPQL